MTGPTPNQVNAWLRNQQAILDQVADRLGVAVDQAAGWSEQPAAVQAAVAAVQAAHDTMNAASEACSQALGATGTESTGGQS